MSLTGHRTERIRVELLNKAEDSLGYLDGVAGGSLSWNANADLPGGGTVEMVERGQIINTSQDRIRVWWEVEGEEPWAMGVYVISAPARQYHDDGSSFDLTLIDKLTVIRDDVLTETVQVPAGANIIDAVVSQIVLTGETRIASTPSTATLTNALTWAPGTSRLKVINDLLRVAGYWALWTDRLGLFRVEPYLLPVDRPVVYDFEEGAASIHSPEWEYELALWEATNRVVFTSQANDAGAFFTAVATDDNPDSPTSTVSMGRTLNPIVEENVEASSQLDLQQQANRKLIDNSNVVGQITVDHRPMPIWYNEAVHFKSQGVDLAATVTKMKLNLEAGALVAAEWRQVA